MSKARTYARNLAANWIGYGSNVVVMFFLTPFIIHQLGDVRYGVWSLLISLVGYMGLVDLGIRPSVQRFINLYLGRGEPDKVNETVNTALAFFLALGPVLLGVALGLGYAFDTIFPRVPADYAGESRLVLVVLAMNLLLTLLSVCVWSIVSAHNRFDLASGAAVLVVTLRAIATVAVLRAGGGLVHLACANLGAEVLTIVFGLGIARHVWPALRLGLSWVKVERLKELLGFGSAMFANAAAQRVIQFADLLIIGWLLGAAEVTYYSLGLMFVQYGRTFLQQVVVTMYPDIAKQGGTQDAAAIRWLTVRGTRVVMFFSVPMLVGLMVLGREFLVVWMGDEAYARSATVLQILALSQVVSMSSEVLRNMLASVGYVWQVAKLGLAEAVLNLSLKVAFVALAGWGLNGVALGTLVPTMLFMGVILPLVGLPLVGLRRASFFIDTTLRWIVGAGLAFAVGSAIAWIPLPMGWPTIAAKIAVAGLALTGIGWVVVLQRDDRTMVVSALRGLWARQNGGKRAGPGTPMGYSTDNGSLGGKVDAGDVRRPCHQASGEREESVHDS